MVGLEFAQILSIPLGGKLCKKEPVMSFGFLVKDLVILVSIASLLLLGLGITLNSGTVAMVGNHQSRKVWDNLLHTALALLACLMTLVMVQQLVGFRLTTLW